MRSTLAVAFAVLAVLAGLPFVLVCLAAGLREPLLAFGLGIARVCRRIAGISLDVSGAAALAPGTPRIYMPNHTSFLDGPLVMLAIPGAARVILKRSILRVPLVGTAMRFVGFVPVDRRGVEGGKKSIARAAAFMKERGYSYLIFPEGTRSLDGRLGPFRRGGFFLALETGAPIVPVTVTGSGELMPKGRSTARPGRVGIVFHEALPTAGLTVETMPELMDRVRAAISGGGTGETGMAGKRSREI
ncbi:MAG: 1-acyl-sn-glycerol-3-phosphate acyltransferase [Candidatus Aminicenantes bacterium]|nr:1-acyl-sn-glycerol-3-phosphate acyltransferase [Candidatus Aminicenantes bacterium]NLH77826.1 1-acyl-sn-glycerol-3-phosphate acyltransferase [Acidobacteriota bacterium]